MPTIMDKITPRMVSGSNIEREWIYWFQKIADLQGAKLDIITGHSGEFAIINDEGEITGTGLHPPVGDLVGTTDVQTLTNKTLIDPYIHTFINAQHNHSSGAEGGVLVIPGADHATLTNLAITACGHTLSGTDKIVGRASTGAGVVEEITCTAAGRAILDDATASDQAHTLGLGVTDTPTFLALILSSGILSQDDDASFSSFRGGSASGSGAQISAYGRDHATLPGNLYLECAGWDALLATSEFVWRAFKTDGSTQTWATLGADGLDLKAGMTYQIGGTPLSASTFGLGPSDTPTFNGLILASGAISQDDDASYSVLRSGTASGHGAQVSVYGRDHASLAGNSYFGCAGYDALLATSKFVWRGYKTDGSTETWLELTTGGLNLSSDKTFQIAGVPIGSGATQLNDSSGNEAICTTATASAVNFWNAINSATTASVTLAADGDDSSVGYTLQAKGDQKSGILRGGSSAIGGSKLQTYGRDNGSTPGNIYADIGGYDTLMSQFVIRHTLSSTPGSYTSRFSIDVRGNVVVGDATSPVGQTAWQASHVYNLNTVVIPTVPNGYDYKCTNRSGDYKSGASEPTWPTTPGATVVDNHVTWTCMTPPENLLVLKNGLILNRTQTDKSYFIGADADAIGGQAWPHVIGEHSFPDTLPVVVCAQKTTTGDLDYEHEGLMCVNTYDNNLKIYAEGAWRTVASW